MCLNTDHIIMQGGKLICILKPGFTTKMYILVKIFGPTAKNVHIAQKAVISYASADTACTGSGRYMSVFMRLDWGRTLRVAAQTNITVHPFPISPYLLCVNLLTPFCEISSGVFLPRWLRQHPLEMGSPMRAGSYLQDGIVMGKTGCDIDKDDEK